MTTRRYFEAVKQPQEEPKEPMESKQEDKPKEPDDDTTQQVAAISQPAEVLSLELEKRIQKVKLRHHALQRRMSPPAGIPVVAGKKT